MAKRQAATADFDLDWIERDRKVIDGLDQLGIELVSVSLYQAMLPGITNVTERARYYSFYPWCIHRFAQDGPAERSRLNWVQWLRPLDFAYALAATAHDQSVSGGGSAVVGAERAAALLKGLSPSDRVEVGPATAVDEKGKPLPSAYFKNAQGGFGQYYRGALTDLGVVTEHDDRSSWPDVKLTNSIGRQLAEALDAQSGFQELLSIATAGGATVADLARVGALIHPRGIEVGGVEQSVLRGVLMGTDAALCQGQRPLEVEWRRQSLCLMLDYLHQAGPVDSDPDVEFRWGCLAGTLPSGAPWKVAGDMLTVQKAWGTYQRNDVMNYALECLMWVVQDVLEDGPRRPQQLADHVADMALGKMPAFGEWNALPSLPAIASDLIRSCERAAAEQTIDPWGEGSTWDWVEWLQAAGKEGNRKLMCGLAVRTLARLATDRGNLDPEPFALIPGASEMASTREVHLERWWQRCAEQHDLGSKAFVVRLLLEWVILRHLRVATRKLAGQGVSTYKFRPEEGELVLVAETPSEPTFTAPRVRQAYRILQDLGYVTKATQGWMITADGIEVVSARPDRS